MGIGNCPVCGTPGAQKGWFSVKCSMKTCKNYNPRHAMEAGAAQQAYSPQYEQPSGPVTVPADFGETAELEYTNFRNERKTFICETKSVLNRGNHISVRVAPSGSRIILNTSKITNIADVEIAKLADENDTQVSIDYVNYKGERKTFVGSRKSAKLSYKALSICVEPESTRITLRYAKIGNLDEVKQAIQ